MKKILIMVVICLIILSIYACTKREEKLVFTIGNNNGDIYREYDNGRVTDIIIDIETNVEIDGRKIQNILIKASDITIDINKFMNVKSYTGVLSQITDLEKLFILLRKYCKENIEIIPLLATSELAEYTNHKISILSEKYDIIIKR